ncbi:MAG: putative membrane-associated metal-dependent hydrolase [Elusimicrobia bacterium]|nr:MAG: putative membrane-associated metal-dependent hydrolase [Elusimicrobiota bacterium]KAF0152146.1 MAG: putative membrane-associated metal-dependent hydrolase [Elusimicrobiota bacterium]
MVWKGIRISDAIKTGALIAVSTFVLLLLLGRTADRLIPGFAGRDEVFFVVQSLVMLFFSAYLLWRRGCITAHSLTFLLKTPLNPGLKSGARYSAFYFAFLSILAAVLVSLVFLAAWTSGTTVADIIKGSEVTTPFSQAVLESKWRMFAYFTGFCFLVPISEEIFFRGILYESLKSRFKIKTSIVLSALIFAIGHVNNFAMSFMAGLYLAFVYEKERDLTAAITVHSALNFAALLVMIFL